MKLNLREILIKGYKKPRKSFILTGYRDASINAYSHSTTLKVKVVGISLLFISVLIPDAGVGLVTGSTLLSGIPLRVKWNSWKNSFKEWRALR